MFVWHDVMFYKSKHTYTTTTTTIIMTDLWLAVVVLVVMKQVVECTVD